MTSLVQPRLRIRSSGSVSIVAFGGRVARPSLRHQRPVRAPSPRRRPPGRTSALREGEVIHVVTDVLEDLSDLLRSVGERDEAFPIVHGRGDGATHPAGRDPRTGPGSVLEMPVPRDIYIPDLRLGSGIKVPTRDFR